MFSRRTSVRVIIAGSAALVDRVAAVVSARTNSPILDCAIGNDIVIIKSGGRVVSPLPSKWIIKSCPRDRAGYAAYSRAGVSPDVVFVLVDPAHHTHGLSDRQEMFYEGMVYVFVGSAAECTAAVLTAIADEQ